jgi:mRNA-degrading endonuclease RelE of RelBE toxin-antitoxin system
MFEIEFTPEARDELRVLRKNDQEYAYEANSSSGAGQDAQ